MTADGRPSHTGSLLARGSLGLVVAAAVALAGDSATAAPRTAQRWLVGKAAVAAAQAALRRCPKLRAAEQLAASDEKRPEYDPGQQVRAFRSGDLLDLDFYETGNGVDREWTSDEWRLDVRRCSAVGMYYGGGDLSYVVSFRYLHDRRGPPTEADRRALATAFDWEIAQPDEVRHAAARLLVEERCIEPKEVSRGWSVRPVLKPVQPWRGGKPTGSAGTVWPAAVLKPLGIVPTIAADRNDETSKTVAADGLLVMPQAAPVRKRSQGGYVLFESPMRGRDRGAAVAIHDTAHDRHCWTVETRMCALGAIRWLGGDADLVVGLATPTHPNYLESRGTTIFAVHLPNCRAYRLWVAGHSLAAQDPELPPPEATPSVVRFTGGQLIVPLRDGKTTTILLPALKQKILEVAK